MPIGVLSSYIKRYIVIMQPFLSNLYTFAMKFSIKTMIYEI